MIEQARSLGTVFLCSEFHVYSNVNVYNFLR